MSITDIEHSLLINVTNYFILMFIYKDCSKISKTQDFRFAVHLSCLYWCNILTPAKLSKKGMG